MSRWLEHEWFPEPLPDNVCIGERSWLYSSFAFRHYLSHRPVGLLVGHDTGLYDGTFFDLGPEGEVTIGDYSTVVGAIICSNRRVVIGNYVFIAHEVVLADEFAAMPPWSGASAVSRASQAFPISRTGVVIEDSAWIGARAVILGGARIGEGAIVGAAAVVDFEVPPYAVVAGNPAQVVAMRPPRAAATSEVRLP